MRTVESNTDMNKITIPAQLLLNLIRGSATLLIVGLLAGLALLWPRVAQGADLSTGAGEAETIRYAMPTAVPSGTAAKWMPAYSFVMKPQPLPSR